MANKNVNDPRLLLIDCITRKLEKMDICTLRLVYNDITKRLDKKRKLVSHHNYLMCSRESDESEGGKIWRDLWQARHERMEAAEREEDRKREERKAKRAAARKAKEEAQKKEQEVAV